MDNRELALANINFKRQVFNLPKIEDSVSKERLDKILDSAIMVMDMERRNIELAFQMFSNL